MGKAWFEDWFNSDYYHLLYGNRDETEAQIFIHNLMQLLPIQNQQYALDLACGKGRHSYQLAAHNLIVDGVDLSENSINIAKESAIENTSFYVHDMREVFKAKHYDYIFNLFTSFGYFDALADNQKVLDSVVTGLKKDGYFVQDFFNAFRVRNELVLSQEIERENIKFKISKQIKKIEQVDTVFKTIKFTADNQFYEFTESVSLFTLEQFEEMYAKAGLRIVGMYGNYHLAPFNVKKSERLILISQPL